MNRRKDERPANEISRPSPMTSGLPTIRQQITESGNQPQPAPYRNPSFSFRAE
jgi:hypothetical protein